MSKYHSKKIIVDGETFDSKKEYRRYRELLLLERAGEISNLQRQVKFLLIPTQYEHFKRYGKNGKELTPGKRVVEKECAYYADFVYTENGKDVVEDTKGVRTPEYIIKRKLLLHIHGIRIKEV
jgi:hypothetical protein